MGKQQLDQLIELHSLLLSFESTASNKGGSWDLFQRKKSLLDEANNLINAINLKELDSKELEILSNIKESFLET